jgi:hypothetical protein
MKEKTLFWKDRLVMPLDMAIKMLNLKMLTNVYNTYIIFFFYLLLHWQLLLTIFSKTLFTVPFTL